MFLSFEISSFMKDYQIRLEILNFQQNLKFKREVLSCYLCLFKKVNYRTLNDKIISRHLYNIITER